MDKFSRIYAAASKCGLSAKHRISDETGKVLFAFKPMDIPLDLFFFISVDDNANELQFVGNVAHAVFLISEDFDPHAETKKYLEAKGLTLQKYANIYSDLVDLGWKIRKLWLSL